MTARCLAATANIVGHSLSRRAVLASGSGLSMIAPRPPLAAARRAVIDKAGSVSPIMVVVR